MEVANRDDFLVCLNQYASRNSLEVFAFSKCQLLAAVEEVRFDDFNGHDYEVMGRLEKALRPQQSEAALWGLVFIDLWYCENFGGDHWIALLNRDRANIRYAIEAAYWVFAVSGSDGGRVLAGMINRCCCWEIATRYISRQTGDGTSLWWQTRVLPHRNPSG
jgi:hypothetical protein